MFVRVVEGLVRDALEARAAFEHWAAQLSPADSGWIGTTGGADEQNHLVALTTFESRDTALKCCELRQTPWDLDSGCFSNAAAVRDSEDILSLATNGELHDATFVRVVQGRYRDPGRARVLFETNWPDWSCFAQHLIGGVTVGFPGGAYAIALYYTSEEAALAAEFNRPPPRLEAVMTELGALNIGLPSVLEFRQPWLLAHG